jgi:hypothetical protein
MRISGPRWQSNGRFSRPAARGTFSEKVFRRLSIYFAANRLLNDDRIKQTYSPAMIIRRLSIGPKENIEARHAIHDADDS